MNYTDQVEDMVISGGRRGYNFEKNRTFGFLTISNYP